MKIPKKKFWDWARKQFGLDQTIRSLGAVVDDVRGAEKQLAILQEELIYVQRQEAVRDALLKCRVFYENEGKQ